MKKNLILVVKGMFMGIANVIPGVSGGTLGIILGIYEQLIEAISHFFKNFKENIKFLIPVGIGMALAILLGSKAVVYALDHYPLVTILFFVGLILGGVPLLSRKMKGHIDWKNILIFVFTASVVLLFAFLNSGDQTVSLDNLNPWGYFLLFLVGLIAAATMVIPGISGSFVLMLLGYYKPVMAVISDLTNFGNLASNLMILIPFGIGVLLGIVLIAKLIEFLLHKFEVPTYYAIMGFVLASIVTIFTQAGVLVFTPLTVILGILLFAVGFFIAYKLGGK